MRHALAQTVWAIHLAFVVFILVAWLLPWKWALWAAVIGYPVVQINWWLFDDRCGLTVLEEWLRSPQAGTARLQAAAAEEEEPLHFIAHLGERLLGRPMPRETADVLSYAVVWGGFAVASLRLVAGVHT